MMNKFTNILVLAVAVINIYIANSFLVSRVQIPAGRGQVGKLFAAKKTDKETVVEEPSEKKGPGGKDVIRGILWATTPWIFNSYEVAIKSAINYLP